MSFWHCRRRDPFRARPETRVSVCCPPGDNRAETACVKRAHAPRQNETRLVLPAGFGFLRRVARTLSAGALLLIGLFPASYAQAPSLHIEPSAIRKDIFYNGATLQVEGVAPSATNVIVVIRGSQASELFNKKGRVGPIWINTDKIHIANVPSLFLSYSSAPIGSILAPASIDAYQLDEASLKQHLTCRCHCQCSTAGNMQGESIAACKGVKPDPQYAAIIRDSFLKLKEQEGSYQFHPGTVRLAASPGGTQYSLRVNWPKSAPTGTYQVEVYACKDRSVVDRASTSLEVGEAGLPLYMADWATSRAWAYGIVAVLLAVFSGFAIDAITSRLRRPRRAPHFPEAAGRAVAQVPQSANQALEEKGEQEPVHHS